MRVCLVCNQIAAWGKISGFGTNARRLGRTLAGAGVDVHVVPHVTAIPYTEILDMLDIQPADVRVALPRLEGYVGLSDWECVTMATLACHYARRPVFEIGTAAGSTTLLLAQNTRQSVYTLDLPSDGADNVFALPRMHSDDRVLAGRRRGALIQSYGTADGRSRIVQLAERLGGGRSGHSRHTEDDQRV